MRQRKGDTTIHVFLIVLALLWQVFLVAGPTRAMEGGISHYVPGTYGDFLVAYVPEPGLYVRNDFLYQSTQLQGTVMGGKTYGHMNDHLLLNLTKLTWMFDAPAIGGLVGFGVGIPVIVNEHVTGSLSSRSDSGPQESGGGDRGGLSDIYIMPVALAWNMGDCHILLSPIIYLPTGYYNPDRITNLGLNYASFDANAAFSWMNKQGCEVSFNAGYTVSAYNQTTNYQSGHEFHFDWTVAYHPNAKWSLGLVGYLYAQTTPDTGSGAAFGSYMSSSAGLGPAVSYTVPVAGRNVSLIVKWIHDTGGVHRLHGDLACFSFAFKF